MKVTLITGAPGSGKTTLAKQLAPGKFIEVDAMCFDAGWLFADACTLQTQTIIVDELGFKHFQLVKTICDGEFLKVHKQYNLPFVLIPNFIMITQVPFEGLPQWMHQEKNITILNTPIQQP